MTTGLWRVRVGGEARLARGPADEGPAEVLAVPDLDDLLRGDGGLSAALAGEAVGPVPAGCTVLAPVQSQPVWAAGVTYERSREARNLESDVPDVYDRVYEAQRPELFLKALPGTVRGPDEPVGIRADSGWDVPEPELTLVLDAGGRVVGYACGNDMSSRSIEGENPLYLPQAKLYRDSCAVGPCLVPVEEAPPVAELAVRLEVHRDGDLAFSGQVPLTAMRRTPQDLAGWLFRASAFPVGVLLMTGTGIVPDESFSLTDGDEVRVGITGLGTLVNRVHTVH